MNNGEKHSADEVMKALQKHEEGCNERHRDIAKNFEETNESIRETNESIKRWGIGSVAFLTLVFGIMSLSVMIVVGIFGGGRDSGPTYIQFPPYPAATVQTQEVQQPVKANVVKPVVDTQQ
ncbi:MAG: hypothetical protein OXF29_02200 [Hyphomicrobiales bacterium]|nr:hypothetical protein [Hyphomicrobiales bacterium]